MPSSIITRRRAIQLGSAVAMTGFPAASRSGEAEAAASQVSPRLFSRGINAWPWLAMPLADPAPGQPYATWPPYIANRPIPTGSDLGKLAAAGFDFIRLVVDPAPFMNTAGVSNSNQFSMLISLLKTAVTQANTAGLGVIVNLQPGGSQRWTVEALYGMSATAATFQNYVNLVAILAQQLGALNISRLALEPVNEPPQDSTTASGLADWNHKLLSLISAARAQAPSLVLVVTGASGGGTTGLQALTPQSLVANYDPLLFTFHFYEPFLFSHQGAPWLATSELQYRWLNNVPWPGTNGTLKATMASVQKRMNADPYTAAAQKTSAYSLTQSLMQTYFNATVDWTYLKPFFDGVANWVAQNNLTADRILLGEFGALKTTTTTLDTWDAPQQSVTGGPYVAANASDRAHYLSDVRVTAEQHGFSWSMWTLFNPGIGLMDETSRTLDPALVSALGLNPT